MWKSGLYCSHRHTNGDSQASSRFVERGPPGSLNKDFVLAQTCHGAGDLPPVFLNQHAHHQGGSEEFSITPGLSSQQAHAAGEVFPQASGAQGPQQVSACEGPQNQDPVHPTSAGPDGDLKSNFNPPSEEDFQMLLGFQKDNGHIKRPLNAFFLWSRIQRPALLKQNPRAKLRDACVQLGHLWSQLSEEDKKPYFEMAFKLKRMHQEKFPDYEFQPKRKNRKKHWSSGQTRQNTKVFAPNPVSAAQSEFQGLSMSACPVMMPLTSCYHYCSSSYTSYMLVDFYSGANIYSGSYPHPYGAVMESVDYSDPWRGETYQASPNPVGRVNQQQHWTADDGHQVLTGLTFTSENLKQTNDLTSQQLSTSTSMDCSFDEHIDVVGLI